MAKRSCSSLGVDRGISLVQSTHLHSEVVGFHPNVIQRDNKAQVDSIHGGLATREGLCGCFCVV